MEENSEIPIHRDFSIFVRSLVRRIIFYVLSLFRVCQRGNSHFFFCLHQLKRWSIAKLMKRGGIFAPTPRLGLASLTSSLIFSSIIFAGWQDIVTPRTLAQVRLDGEELMVNSEVLVREYVSETIIPEGRGRDEVIEYTIQPGDTLSSIGERFKVSMESLAYINDIRNENLLSVGETFKIPPVSGVIHAVKTGETVSSIAQKWSVPPQSIVDINWLDEPYLLSVGQELVIPNAVIPAPQPQTFAGIPTSHVSGGLQLQPQAAGTGKFLFPAAGKITQYFSWYHPAIDIANSSAPDVMAADSGTIVYSGWKQGGYGITVWVDHGNGFVTQYVHLSNAYVSPGQAVSRGQAVGRMGATGRAYGTHLHFVILQNGRAINPLSVL